MWNIKHETDRFTVKVMPGSLLIIDRQQGRACVLIRSLANWYVERMRMEGVDKVCLEALMSSEGIQYDVVNP